MLQRFIDGPAQNSGQRLDNVNQTLLVLASGKLVLRKKTYASKLVIMSEIIRTMNTKRKISNLFFHQKDHILFQQSWEVQHKQAGKSCILLSN